ncbi:unnamed protein product [Moneuplotes crassus]|uniref:Uncharacterized protein n=1 Tax=Euplotes crassus TaxID=5936 RepID=A0AAD1UIR4_EUPCR|nr:unnamed protein product [Moneuplotes crassus]
MGSACCATGQRQPQRPRLSFFTSMSIEEPTRIRGRTQNSLVDRHSYQSRTGCNTNRGIPAGTPGTRRKLNSIKKELDESVVKKEVVDRKIPSR